MSMAPYHTWIAIGEQRTDGQQHLRDGQRWRPVVLENVQTDDALTVYIAVIYPGAEGNLRIPENVDRRQTTGSIATHSEHHTLGGLNGYSGEKWMSKKNTPPSYTEPGGPRIVDTHSYRLSLFGPALQLGGGSSVISASSFWMRLVDVPSALLIFGLVFGSALVSSPPAVDATIAVADAAAAPLADEWPLVRPLVPLRLPLPLALLEPALVDILCCCCCVCVCVRGWGYPDYGRCSVCERQRENI